MTDKSIWMPIYWADWMKDTSRLSLQEQGAYFMLLKEYWNNGGALPDDKTRLYRSCGAQSRSEKESINTILEAYFLHENGVYYHERIEGELLKAKETRARHKERSKKANEIKASYKDTYKVSYKAPQSQSHISTDVDIEKDKAKALSKKKPPPRERGSRLPDDWKPTQKDIDYAKELSWSDERIRIIAKEFHDYWTTLVGPRAIKIKWDRVWQKWCDKANEWGTGASKPGGYHPQSSFGENLQRAAEQAPVWTSASHKLGLD